MTGSFFGLNTGVSALVASQLALETAAHNSANAATEGYSRQRVSMVASDPFSYPTFSRSGQPGQIGTGVSAAVISRVRDAFVDLQLRQESSVSSAWTTRSDQLNRLQDVFPEPGNSGLGGSLARFWNAWQDAAADPSSSAARNAVLQQSAALATDLNAASRQVTALIGAQNDAVTSGIAELNTLASQIATLNGDIRKVAATGEQPNDLMDQRDLLLDKLADLVPARLEPQRDGTVKVLLGGTDLVNGDQVRTVVAQPTANGPVPSWGTGLPVALGTARMGQLIQLRDTDLPAYRSKLDALASGIATAVNAIHVSGVDQDGRPGVAFFTSTDGGPITAATIQVNPAVAASARRVVTAGAPNQPGDGSIAGRIADLQTGSVVAGQQPGDFYASIVGEVGADAAHASTMQENQGLIVEHLKTRRESLSGVSLDEEATDMVRFQHQYQAAARVITIMDQNLDTIINGLGTIGR